MNFKCQCPQIKLYWNAATYIRLYHLCLCSCSDGRVEPCERGLLPTNPKIFKSGPFQKKFADPRWTISGKLHKTWTMAAASGEGMSKGHKQKGDFLKCNFFNFWILNHLSILREHLGLQPMVALRTLLVLEDSASFMTQLKTFLPNTGANLMADLVAKFE